MLCSVPWGDLVMGQGEQVEGSPWVQLCSEQGCAPGCRMPLRLEEQLTAVPGGSACKKAFGRARRLRKSRFFSLKLSRAGLQAEKQLLCNAGGWEQLFWGMSGHRRRPGELWRQHRGRS